MKPRMVTQIHLNPHLRVYHVNWEISQRPIEMFNRPLAESDTGKLAELGEAGATLVREVLTAVGTTKVTIKPYELAVNKSPAFDWKEMESSIVASIKKTFGAEAENVEVQEHFQNDPVKKEESDDHSETVDNLSAGKEDEEEEK